MEKLNETNHNGINGSRGKSQSKESAAWRILRRQMHDIDPGMPFDYGMILRNAPEDKRKKLDKHLAKMCQTAVKVGMSRKTGRGAPITQDNT